MAIRAVARHGDETGARWLELDGCFNFRDVGGYPGPPGQQVRWRRLFRSDALQDLGPADEERIARLGLRTVIDLRTAAEAEATEQAGYSLAPATRHHLPMPDLPTAVALQTVAAEAVLVAGQYRDVLGQSMEAVQEVLAILTDASTYPAVISCSGGHHRTGIMAALVLGLAGVPDDTVVADYLASRDALVRRTKGPQRSPLALVQHGPAMLGVLGQTMIGFLAQLRGEYGSLRGYARHIDMAAAIPYLRANLLSPAG